MQPPAPHLITHTSFIAPLGGLRGVAALLVVIYHVGPDMLPGFRLQGGYLWVDFFLILSGFLISAVYGDAIRTRRMSFHAFAFRRAARLFPCYWLGLGVMLAVTPVGYSILAWILQLSLLQGLFELPSWNGPTWTISVEWIVNILFFFWFLWAYRCAAETPLLLTIVAACAFHLMSASPHTLDVYFPIEPYFNPALVRAIMGFSLGILLYRWHIHLPRLSREILHFLEAVLILMLLAFFFSVSAGLPYHNYLFPLLLAPALLLICMYRGSFLGAVFSARPLQWLGLVSYSVYCLHRPVESIFRPLFSLVSTSGHIELIAYIAALLALCALSYRWVEMPFQKLGKAASPVKQA